jgi:hypothetical protein
MVHLGRPPTQHRYLAEIKNVLEMRVRPVSIHGYPKASVSEIQRFLGATRLSQFELQVRDTLIVWREDYLELVAA